MVHCPTVESSGPCVHYASLSHFWLAASTRSWALVLASKWQAGPPSSVTSRLSTEPPSLPTLGWAGPAAWQEGRAHSLHSWVSSGSRPTHLCRDGGHEQFSCYESWRWCLACFAGLFSGFFFCFFLFFFLFFSNLLFARLPHHMACRILAP